MKFNTFLLFLLLLFAGCPSKGESPAITDSLETLIIHGGGVGGGPNGGTVNVLVFDNAYAKTPLAGIDVQLIDSANVEFNVITDAEGKGTFTGIAPGAVTITSMRDGYDLITFAKMNASLFAFCYENEEFITATGLITGIADTQYARIYFENFNDQPEDTYGRTIAEIQTNNDIPFDNNDFEITISPKESLTLYAYLYDEATDKIVKSTTIQVGPYNLGDSVTNLAIDFTSVTTTGLHWIEGQFSVPALPTWAVIRNGIDFRYGQYNEINIGEYQFSWNASTKAGTFKAQLPPNQAGLFLISFDIGSGIDYPRGRAYLTYPYTTGPADNAVSTNPVITYDVVSIQGQIIAGSINLGNRHRVYYKADYFTSGTYDNGGVDFRLLMMKGKTYETVLVENDGATSNNVLQQSYYGKKSYNADMTTEAYTFPLKVAHVVYTSNLPSGIIASDSNATVNMLFNNNVYEPSPYPDFRDISIDGVAYGNGAAYTFNYADNINPNKVIMDLQFDANGTRSNYFSISRSMNYFTGSQIEMLNPAILASPANAAAVNENDTTLQWNFTYAGLRNPQVIKIVITGLRDWIIYLPYGETSLKLPVIPNTYPNYGLVSGQGYSWTVTYARYKNGVSSTAFSRDGLGLGEIVDNSEFFENDIWTSESDTWDFNVN